MIDTRHAMQRTLLGGHDYGRRRRVQPPLGITPEMIDRGGAILAGWMAENAEFLELGALGHVEDLLARIWPIFPNSCMSTLETESKD